MRVQGFVFRYGVCEFLCGAAGGPFRFKVVMATGFRNPKTIRPEAQTPYVETATTKAQTLNPEAPKVLNPKVQKSYKP